MPKSLNNTGNRYVHPNNVKKDFSHSAPVKSKERLKGRDVRHLTKDQKKGMQGLSPEAAAVAMSMVTQIALGQNAHKGTSSSFATSNER